MAKGQLFEYAVLYHPRRKETATEASTQGKSVIIVDVTRVVAASDAEVRVLAARALPEEYLDRLDDVEILVRPFAKA